MTVRNGTYISGIGKPVADSYRLSLGRLNGVVILVL